MQAIRGAITVEENTPEAIAAATRDLLGELVKRNSLRAEDLISAFFTLTPDLDADFPARTARSIGWDVPMLDMVELAVPGSLPRCLRVLLHVRRAESPRHAYLRDARSLRPDLEEE